jgi:hypothetical protein
MTLRVHIIFGLLLALILVGCADISSADIHSYSELTSSPLPVRHGAIITHDVTYTNLCPAGWIVDPLDNTKFLLYVGRFQGNTDTGADIALYTGNLSDPYTLTLYGSVLGPSGSGWDSATARFGSAVYDNGTVYYYYMGQNGTGITSYKIGVATSTDGGRTFTRYASNPILVGETGEGVTDPSVIKIGATWYMYYSPRYTPGTPYGIDIATSSDGLTWTKTGTAAVRRGPTYDNVYLEGGQILALGSDYVLLYNGNSQTDYWTINLAYSNTPNATFEKYGSNPYWTGSGSGGDSTSVAVPLLVEPTPGRWILYYQGSQQYQPASLWDVFAAEYSPRPQLYGGTLFGGSVR